MSPRRRALNTHPPKKSVTKRPKANGRKPSQPARSNPSRPIPTPARVEIKREFATLSHSHDHRKKDYSARLYASSPGETILPPIGPAPPFAAVPIRATGSSYLTVIAGSAVAIAVNPYTPRRPLTYVSTAAVAYAGTESTYNGTNTHESTNRAGTTPVTALYGSQANEGAFDPLTAGGASSGSSFFAFVGGTLGVKVTMSALDGTCRTSHSMGHARVFGRPAGLLDTTADQGTGLQGAGNVQFIAPLTLADMEPLNLTTWSGVERPTFKVPVPHTQAWGWYKNSTMADGAVPTNDEPLMGDFRHALQMGQGFVMVVNTHASATLTVTYYWTLDYHVSTNTSSALNSIATRHETNHMTINDLGPTVQTGVNHEVTAASGIHKTISATEHHGLVAKALDAGKGVLKAVGKGALTLAKDFGQGLWQGAQTGATNFGREIGQGAMDPISTVRQAAQVAPVLYYV